MKNVCDSDNISQMRWPTMPQTVGMLKLSLLMVGLSALGLLIDLRMICVHTRYAFINIRVNYVFGPCGMFWSLWYVKNYDFRPHGLVIAFFVLMVCFLLLFSSLGINFYT